MASRVLQVEITGDAKSFQNALRQAEGSNKSFGTSLGSLAKGGALAAGAAGVGGLFLALKAGIGEYKQSQEAAAQTGAVLKSTGGAANVTAKQVTDLSTALMKKSGTDDEAIQSGENMLLTFTKIRNEAGKGNDIFAQTTKATLDLSVAMGKDMKNSAILVGKALNDPLKGLTALTRVGVSFTAQQKATIKALLDSGGAAKDAAKAQKAAAEEVKAATSAVASAQAGVEAATRRVETAQLAEQAAARAVVAAQDALTASSDRVRAAKENVTTSSQHLQDAQEKERDSVQKVTDAEQALKTAQENVKTAQEALTQARVDAAQTLDRLKDANRDAKFSEEEAQIRLERAQERLDKVMKDSTSTDLDKREALLDVKEATAGVSDAQDRAKQAAVDQAKAEKDGVEGSKGVVDAKAAVHKAQEDEEKSARAVIKAQKDQQKAAQDILKAERDLVDSQGKVAEAQLKTVRAQQDLVVSQQAAARATGDVKDAQAGAGEAADKLTTAHQRLATAQDAASAAQDKGKKAVGSASDLLKAQKIILAELNKEFGGSAEAYGKTLPGQIDILKQRFNNFAGELVAKMVPVMLRLTAWLNEELPPAVAKAGEIINGLSGFWDDHGATIMLVLTDVANIVTGTFKTVTDTLQIFSDLLSGDWSKAWTDFKTLVSDQIDLVEAKVVLQIDLMKAAFGGLATWVAAKAKDIVDVFIKLPGQIAATLADLAKTALDKFKAKFTDAKDWVGGMITATVGFFTGLPARIFATLADLATTALNPFKTAFTTAKTWVGQKVDEIVKFFVDLPGRLGGKVLDTLKTAFGAVGTAIANAIKAPINAALGAWNNLRVPGFHVGINMPGPIPDIDFGWDGMDLPDIPMLAKGGIVGRPTLAMLGESGPEAVIPLTRGGAGMGGDTYVTVIVEGSVTSEGKLVDKIKAGLVRDAARNGRTLYA